MAKVSDDELVVLVKGALDSYVAAQTINLDNVSQNVAESIVHALHGAGATVIREERDRGVDAEYAAAIARLRQAVAA